MKHKYLFVEDYVSVSVFISSYFTDMSPKSASYYGNRAATLMMLCRYREALEDCQQAVRLDNSFMKASYGKIIIAFFSTGI